MLLLIFCDFTLPNKPADIYLFKFKNGKTRTMCEILSKLTIKVPEFCHWNRCGVVIDDFDQVMSNQQRSLQLYYSQKVSTKYFLDWDQ